MIKAIVFDLDDTLYSEKDFVYGAFEIVSEFIANKKNLESKFIFEQMMKTLDAHGRGKIFDIVCDENSIDIPIDDLVEVYRNAKPKISLFVESLEILKFLKKEGYKTGIITDGISIVQWNKIKQLDIKIYVDNIIVTGDFGDGFSKPNTKSFIEMARLFNVKPCEIIYVGDNPNKDFIGAREIGYKTVQIKNKYSEYGDLQLEKKYGPDYIIYNLLDLILILQEIKK